MLNALKTINKGILILIIAIICIPIFILIFLAIIQSCSTKISHEKYENKMISAAASYIKSKKINVSSVETIELDELVDGKYIKSPEKLIGDSSCTGTVTVRRNGVSNYLEAKGDLSYISKLVCKDYKSNNLVNLLMKNLTTEESGLYTDGNYYVFKGDRVKNYIRFFGVDYRIMSIDKNDVVKLIKSESETTTRIWDKKYNSEIGYSYGKSIYKDSSILKALLKDYTNKKKISLDARKHIVSYDTCIGKRDVNDYSISRELDCSEILTDQLISLVNISDYSRASLDPDCTSIRAKSCNNYNYLTSVISSTWTLNSVANNSYQVYYINDGIVDVQNASEHNTYNLVIYIDGNEIVKSGKGTVDNPYIIE